MQPARPEAPTLEFILRYFYLLLFAVTFNGVNCLQFCLRLNAALQTLDVSGWDESSSLLIVSNKTWINAGLAVRCFCYQEIRKPE